MKLFKLFIICFTICVFLAFIRDMMNNVWRTALQETGEKLNSYQVPLSHGMLPTGSKFSCNERLGFQRLDVEFDGHMYVIEPASPDSVSIGCRILTDQAID